MTIPRARRIPWLVAGGAALVAALAFYAQKAHLTSSAAQSGDPWTHGQVMTPESLAKELSGPASDRPAVVCVGVESLYQTAHVSGAVLEGPGREPKGIEAITKWAHDVPRDKEVVLYCGCCPWTQCPNIRPAFRALHALGFRRLRVVEIDQDFAHDWVAKGYPVEKGK